MAYLVAKARGVDIFNVGTRNPGAANTFRSIGRSAGVLVFALDAAKGVAAVFVAAALGVAPLELRVAAGAAAVLGHWYPVFLRFRGGAGLAPSLGVGFGVLPLAALIGFVPGVLTLVRFRSTGDAAGVGFALFLIAGVLMGQWRTALAVTLLAVLVMVFSRLVHARRSATKGRG